MGRSSCLKAITCGGVDGESDAVSEGRRPFDKHRWSFRRKSIGHRISNHMIIPGLNSSRKEIHQPENASGQSSSTISAVQDQNDLRDSAVERSQLSSDTEQKKVASTAGETSSDNQNLEEPVVIFMQASIRRFLAEKEASKLKHVTKLQAAVRGQLVRQQALGTLQCIQGIMKFQIYIRDKYSVLSQHGPSLKKPADSNHDKDKHFLSDQDKQFSSIQKLLKNRFVQQLRGYSGMKTKRICITCDVSKSSSIWEWLERWSSLSSMRDWKTEDDSVSVYESEEILHNSDHDKTSLSMEASHVEPAKVDPTGIDIDASEGELHKANVGKDEEAEKKSSFQNVTDEGGKDDKRKLHGDEPEIEPLTSHVSLSGDSPTSRTMGSESQETPNQGSVKYKTKTPMISTSQKESTPASSKSSTVSKTSQKIRKKNSSGYSSRRDRNDNETRSDGSSGLPRFMQATESARAKIHMMNSPRSISPDVQEQEHFKKRYSLPGASGKQDARHIQRSSSQTHHKEENSIDDQDKK